MLYANKYHESLPLIERVERSKAIVNKILEVSSTFPAIKEEKKNFISFTEDVFKKYSYYLAH